MTHKIVVTHYYIDGERVELDYPITFYTEWEIW